MGFTGLIVGFTTGFAVDTGRADAAGEVVVSGAVALGGVASAMLGIAGRTTADADADVIVTGAAGDVVRWRRA